MSRYITRSFVTDDRSKLASLCAMDRTPSAGVRVTQDVSVLHVSRYWSYWSDGKIIRQESVMREDRQCLSDMALKLIGRAIDANSGQAEGGLGTLARVAMIISQETLVDMASRGNRRRVTLEKWGVLLTDDTQAELFVLSETSSQGYTFDAYWSRESAERDLVTFGLPPLAQSSA